MTLGEDNLLVIRDEFPDLDAEVRSILMARAQDGATISLIRQDYRKNTGLHFPVVKNVVEYLLSIPSVSAVCNPRGTLIFNIMPTEQTKHLYDLIMQQKSQQAQPRTPYSYRNVQSRLHPYMTAKSRSNTNIKLQQQQQEQRNSYSNFNDNQNNNSNDPAAFTVIHQPIPPFTAADTNNGIQENCDYPVQQNIPTIANGEQFHNNRNTISNSDPPQEVHSNNYSGLNTQQNIPTIENDEQLHTRDIISNSVNPQEFHSNNNNNLAPELQPTQQHQKVRNINHNIHINLNRNNNAFRRYPRLRMPGRNHVITTSPSGTRTSKTNDSMFTICSDYEARLLDFPLLGDDFFLYMARMELRCKFKPNKRVLQSGLCVSGQTIRDAIERVQRMPPQSNKYIIVNIGSVDIMKGRPLIRIEYEFRKLVRLLIEKGMIPILTTLAPLANFAHVPLAKNTLERFNDFIRHDRKDLKVIDIWSCLVNERKQTMFGCFQREPRIVTGTSEPYVFWNNIGRRRVLQMLEANIEYFNAPN